VRWRATLAGCSVTVHQHLDGTFTLTHGPHRLGHYSAEGVSWENNKIGARGAVEKTRTFHLLQEPDILICYQHVPKMIWRVSWIVPAKLAGVNERYGDISPTIRFYLAVLAMCLRRIAINTITTAQPTIVRAKPILLMGCALWPAT
jgi:hypothetical protein